MSSSAVASTARRPHPTGAVVVALGALGYVLVLHYIYATHIAPDFAYLQYAYRSPDPLYYGLALVLVVVVALTLPRRLTHPSHFIVWVLFLLLVAPLLTVSQYAPALDEGEAFELALWAAGCFLLIAVLGTRQPLRGFLPRIVVDRKTFWIGVLAVYALLSLYVVVSVGVNTHLPSLDDVNGVRGEFRQETSADPALGYVGPLLVTVVNPLMMLRGLWERRWLWFAAGMIGQLYLYAAQGNKTALFSPFALAAAFLLFRRPRPPSAATLTVAAPIWCVAMYVGDLLTATNDFTSNMVRRLLVTPGLVTVGFVQVFDGIPKAHLGYSVLSPWFKYPYLLEPSDLVGVEFFGDPQTHANGSWLADGYANFGYGGMLAASIVVVVLLWGIDDAARGLPVGVAALLFLMPALTLAESAVLTAILTHGYFVAIVLCLLAPRDGWRQRGVTVETAVETGERQRRSRPVERKPLAVVALEL
ncbi:MAG TPA: hypothetical protein VNT27_11120 [Propionibacteriaceae bacterium]|nr:hypothetical protein [Propionibacteriaceae bacterium]